MPAAQMRQNHIHPCVSCVMQPRSKANEQNSCLLPDVSYCCQLQQYATSKAAVPHSAAIKLHLHCAWRLITASSATCFIATGLFNTTPNR
jgi:hypothetical protein